MAISPRLTTALKNFSGKPLGVMSKALGVASVAAVVYDSHINGKRTAIVKDERDTADRFLRQFEQSTMSSTDSATVIKLKKHWFDFQQGLSVYSPISKTVGYTDGFLSTVIRELPVVGMSAIALASKSWVGKAAGVGLALNGIKTLLFDVFCIGNKPDKLL